VRKGKDVIGGHYVVIIGYGKSGEGEDQVVIDPANGSLKHGCLQLASSLSSTCPDFSSPWSVSFSQTRISVIIPDLSVVLQRVRQAIPFKGKWSTPTLASKRGGFSNAGAPTSCELELSPEHTPGALP